MGAIDCMVPVYGINTREVDTATSELELEEAGLRPEEIRSATIYRGTGCPACSETGFKGRIALYEVMPLTDDLKEFVLNGASALELKQEAIRGGMVTLRRSALNKLLDGVTTVSEVYRVSAVDH